jgi:hypothetical protein
MFATNGLWWLSGYGGNNAAEASFDSRGRHPQRNLSMLRTFPTGLDSDRIVSYQVSSGTAREREFKPMPCIFCRSTEDLTDEHVFPAFSGAHLTVKDGTCTKCNGECGQFEDRVARQTETARHIFEIPNRYGRIPTARVEVEVQGAKTGTVAGRRNPDGEIQLYDFVNTVQTDDGRTVREGFFVSQQSAEKFIERAKKRGKKVTELDVPKDVTLLSSSQQTIAFAFSGDIRRMVAKIALVSVAYKYGPEYACHPQLDTLRAAIFGAAEDLPLRIFANADCANDHIRTPRHHAVRAYLSAGMHKGWILVTLFGGLTYIVELTRCFDERESRHFSLFYDTELQATFNPIVLFDEQEIIGRVLSHQTVFEEQGAIDAQWYPIVERYCQENDLELSRISPPS